MRVAPHDHRIDPFDGRRHDVGAAGELAAAPVDGLMHGAALEEVVALVGAAAGVEEGEHSGDEQRRAVVRDGEGAGEDGGRLAVLAVRAGDEVARLDVDAGAGPVAERAVLEQRDAVELHAVARQHLAQQAAGRDAAVGADASELRVYASGLLRGHALQRGDKLRTVAVEGRQIGRLRSSSPPALRCRTGRRGGTRAP